MKYSAVLVIATTVFSSVTVAAPAPHYHNAGVTYDHKAPNYGHSAHYKRSDELDLERRWFGKDKKEHKEKKEDDEKHSKLKGAVIGGITSKVAGHGAMKGVVGGAIIQKLRGSKHDKRDEELERRWFGHKDDDKEKKEEKEKKEKKEKKDKEDKEDEKHSKLKGAIVGGIASKLTGHSAMKGAIGGAVIQKLRGHKNDKRDEDVEEFERRWFGHGDDDEKKNKGEKYGDKKHDDDDDEHHSKLKGAIVGGVAGALTGHPIKGAIAGVAVQSIRNHDEEDHKKGEKEEHHSKLKGAFAGGAAGLLTGSPIKGAIAGAVVQGIRNHD